MCRQKYFLSEDLARAAELQVQQLAVSTGTKFQGATTSAMFLEKTIREASGNSEFLRDFLLSWMPYEQHVMGTSQVQGLPQML